MYIHTQLATRMSTILVQCNMKCSTCDVCVFLPLICLQTGHQSLDATVVSVRSKLTKVGMLHLYMCEKCGLFLAKCLLTRSEQCRHLLLLMPIRLTIQYVITYYIECIWLCIHCTVHECFIHCTVHECIYMYIVHWYDVRHCQQTYSAYSLSMNVQPVIQCIVCCVTRCIEMYIQRSVLDE